MNTIYNLIYQNEPIAKGVIEIIQRYDGNYYDIALDGAMVEDMYKEDYTPTIISRKFIKKCCKATGKTEDELVFTMYNFYSFGTKHVTNFDTNDYESYEEKFKLIKQHLNSHKEIDDFKSKHMNYRYFGIGEVEVHLT